MGRTDVHQLVVVARGDINRLYGTREEMHEQKRRLVDALNTPEGARDKVLVLKGFADSYDRAEVELMIVLDDVSTASVCEF